MKKVINIKEIMIILVSVLLITFSTTVFATDNLNLVLGNNGNTPTQIPSDEYKNAQNVQEVGNNSTGNNSTGNNSTGNNSTGNNSTANNSTGNNSVKKYNTNNSTDLPQTGIEDYNIGILLVVCIASAIFAYKKITDYKSI